MNHLCKINKITILFLFQIWFGIVSSFSSDSDESIFKMDDSPEEKSMKIELANCEKKESPIIFFKASPFCPTLRTFSETSYFSPKKEDKKNPEKKLSLSSSSNAVPVVLDTFLSVPYSPDLNSSDSDEEDILFRFDRFNDNHEHAEEKFIKKKKNHFSFNHIKEINFEFPDIIQNSKNEKSVIFLAEKEESIIDLSALSEQVTAKKTNSTLTLLFTEIPSFTLFLPENLNIFVKNAYKSIFAIEVPCHQLSFDCIQESNIDVKKEILTNFTFRNKCSKCKINVSSISGDIEAHFSESSLLVQSIQSSSVFLDMSYGTSCVFKAGNIQELEVFVRDENSVIKLFSDMDIKTPIAGKIRCSENINSEKNHESRCKIIPLQSKGPRANTGFC